jgi:hypothetical protein
MGRCIFQAKEVISLIKHAIETESTSRSKPALMLVHDQGVYLMSNGTPGLPNKEGKEGAHVVYAEGCHPDRDADFWTTARDLVGGDDFGEKLPLNDPNDMLRKCGEYDLMILYVNPTNIQIAFGHDVPAKIHS